jgi:hypothetical protein
MPTISDILAFLSGVPVATALLVLIAAACLMVTVNDWRVSIFTLTLHYVLAGFFLARVTRADIAIIKILVGAMICITLYITARRADETKLALKSKEPALLQKLPQSRLRLESGWPFRLLVAILGLAVVNNVVERIALPGASRETALACFILLTEGLLTLCLAEEPLKGGLGVLTVIIGFDLFYSGIEQSLIVVGLLGLVNFAIALSIAYLATVQASILDEVA